MSFRPWRGEETYELRGPDGSGAAGRVEAITSVWDKPVSESRSQNGPVSTLAGNTDSTAVATRSAMGFIGSTQASTKTTSSTPITIHCRLQLFTDTNKRVIGFKGDDANGARSSMFQQLSHQ